MERKKMTNNPPKSVQRLNQINTPHRPLSIDKENQKTIGIGTVDYWLWIMDQELWAAFGE